MQRSILTALALLGLLVGSASAQQWATKMFTTTDHDFGTVARGAKSEFRFEFKNIYKEQVHVAGVRSSCGCTTPRVEGDSLATYQAGAVVAHFNTDRFLGNRSATLTVTFDKPFFAEVRLQIRGNIRGDVVVEPGAVDFQTVNEGEPAERPLRVKYASGGNWTINDVRSANPNFEAEIRDTKKENGQTVCNLMIRLKEGAPAGYISDQVILVTSDRTALEIPVWVEGRIVPELTVSPTSLVLGDVVAGNEITRKVIVRGRQPFKVVGVDCGDDCFAFKSSDEEKTLHTVDVTFRPKTPGKIEASIAIRTDRKQDVAASINVFANVLPNTDTPNTDTPNTDTPPSESAEPTVETTDVTAAPVLAAPAVPTPAPASEVVQFEGATSAN